MKFQKTISFMVLMGSMVLGGTKLAHAIDINQINAIALARAQARTQALGTGIANTCQDLLAEVSSNGEAACEERRGQCEDSIRDEFNDRVQRRIAACEDNSAATIAECLTNIDLERQLAIAKAKFKARLLTACRAEDGEAQPTDPVDDNPAPAVQDQNQNQGVENPPAAQVGNGAQNGAGGCSMNGMSGGAGNLATFILGFLPLAAAWSRKKK